MASNKIVIEVELDDSGSFKLVEQQAKKAAKATDDLGKSRNRYNKGEKGVIGATSNGTKAFSKMRDSMTGSTGLVSAYAVLASNVFAATAAFNAFRRAAQVQQLEAGLLAVGAAAGTNLGRVSDGLREITGEALSAEQAMRATALASASGFRSDQLNDLAKVAKGASLALGRDMGDAFDRLVRGTAKVEPEILDELGIFVRLDDAVRDYADRLGVAEGSLTQYDRSQAFLNATLDQGLKKYKDLSEQIDPNPYDKLSAALADLQKNALGFVNNFLKLGDVVGFASRNLLSLTAVATTLGGAVTSTVAPGLLRMAESSAESAENLLENRKAMAKTLTTAKGLPPVFNSLVEKIDNGSATTKEFGSAHASLLGQLGANERKLKAFTAEATKAGPMTAEAAEQIEILSNNSATMRQRMADLKDVQAEQTNASIAASRANGVANATSLNLVAAFKDLGQAHKEDIDRTNQSAESKRGLSKALHGIGPAARTGAAGLKVLGAAFFTVLPYIGIIISGLTVLYGVIKEKFFPEDIVKKRIEEATESLEFFNEIQTSFFKNTSTGGKRLAESYIALAGIMNSVRSEIVGVSDVAISTTTDKIAKEQEEIRKLKDELVGLETRLKSIQSVSASVGTVRNRAGQVVTQNRGRSNQSATQNAQSKVDEKRAEIAEKEAKAAELVTRIEAERVKGMLAISAAAREELRIQMLLAEARGEETNPFNLSITNTVVKELDNLHKQLQDGKITADEYIIAYDKVSRRLNNIKASFEGVDEAVGRVNANISRNRVDAPQLFQQETDDINALLKLFQETEAAAKEVKFVSVTPGFSIDGSIPPVTIAVKTDDAKEAELLLKELESRIKTLNLPDQYKNGREGLKAYVDDIIGLRNSINAANVSLAEQKQAFGEIKAAASGIAGGIGQVLEAEQAMIATELSAVNDTIKAKALTANLTEAEFLKTKDGVKLLEDRTNLEEKRIDQEYIKLKTNQSLLQLDKQRNQLAAQRVTNDLRILKIQDSLSGRRTTPTEQFEASVREAKARVTAAQAELEFVDASAAIRRAILEAEMIAAGVDETRRENILGLLDDQLSLQREITAEKLRSAEIGVTEVVAGGITEATSQAGAQGMRGEGIDTGLRGAIQTGGDNLALAQQQEAEAQALRNTALKGDESGIVDYKQLEVAEQALIRAQENVKTAGVNMITGILDSQAEALAKLGPEGEILAAFTTFSADLLSNMDAFANAGESTADRLAAGFTMAASAIGGIGQIMAAQSRQQIGEIDNQIAAEKKRDGKSKESLAKIATLEKKKEAMEKKAFERNKKMQMAQTIANTAAGIMGVLSGVKDPIFTMPLALAQVGIIAAMGAAQLAVIAGTSFQGGGSAPNPGGGQPSQISMGARRNTTDLARSQSARGELAYFRGEAGSGGPENFRNAFAGYRNRAAGGNTAFMVGEQGPEMFVPETPGTIVPNDEAAQAAPTNVNFSINAVDAAGVEDLLIRQQGNIIGMIREAANSYGQDFVETVDTSVFNDTTSGVSRY